jgi:Uma2 family endonuclease
MSDTLARPSPHRVPMTRAMCRRLADSGLLPGKFELIDGEVLSKIGQNPLHAFVITLITTWIQRVFGEAFVRAQLSMDISTPDADINYPEPDMIAMSRPFTAFLTQHPTPADVLLLVEVSDTTLRFDLRVKAALYARAGVAEYWVADIVGRRFVVHREAGETGYAQVVEYGEEEPLSPASRPDIAVRVADLLPPIQP